MAIRARRQKALLEENRAALSPYGLRSSSPRTGLANALENTRIDDPSIPRGFASALARKSSSNLDVDTSNRSAVQAHNRQRRRHHHDHHPRCCATRVALRRFAPYRCHNPGGIVATQTNCTPAVCSRVTIGQLPASPVHHLSERYGVAACL